MVSRKRPNVTFVRNIVCLAFITEVESVYCAVRTVVTIYSRIRFVFNELQQHGFIVVFEKYAVQILAATKRPVIFIQAFQTRAIVTFKFHGVCIHTLFSSPQWTAPAHHSEADMM
jgi:hypothetical protein